MLSLATLYREPLCTTLWKSLWQPREYMFQGAHECKTKPAAPSIEECTFITLWGRRYSTGRVPAPCLLLITPRATV
jgi:hypothetical protein